MRETLAVNSTKTIVMRDSSQVSITSKGGRASYVVTPETGDVQSRTFGPGVETAVIGPFDEGATLVITNLSAALTYRYIGGNIPTVSSDGTSLASGDGTPIPYARILGQGLDIAGSRTVTGTTNETSAYQLTIPANSMGAEGSLRISCLWSMTNDASNKSLRVKFGNATPLTLVSTTASIVSMAAMVTIQNMGATNSQEAHASITSSLTSTATAIVTAAMDTTVDQLLEITLQLADGTDTASLRRVLVELIRP